MSPFLLGEEGDRDASGSDWMGKGGKDLWEQGGHLGHDVQLNGENDWGRGDGWSGTNSVIGIRSIVREYSWGYYRS